MREFFPALVFIAVMLWAACDSNIHQRRELPGIIQVVVTSTFSYLIDAENKICVLVAPRGVASVSDEKCTELIKRYGSVEQ